MYTTLLLQLSVRVYNTVIIAQLSPEKTSLLLKKVKNTWAQEMAGKVPFTYLCTTGESGYMIRVQARGNWGNYFLCGDGMMGKYQITIHIKGF